MQECKWTVITRPIGIYCRQRFKRFITADNFAKAKAFALKNKVRRDEKYEGLYRWSDWDFAHAIQKTKRKLAFKRRVRDFIAKGYNFTEANTKAREPKRRHKRPFVVDMGI